MLPVLAGLAWMPGCSHPCGYADVRSTLLPTAGEQRVTTTTLPRPLGVTREITGLNAVLEIKVSALETTEGPARMDTYGKLTYVTYQWYTPFVKLGAILSLVCPWYLPAHDPHIHGAGNWTRSDYFRDVLAWYNLCSGLPTGPRDIDLEEQLIRSETLRAPFSQRLAPVPGRSVTLSLDGKELAKAVTGADGTVRFDLAPFLKPELAKGNHTLQIVTPVGSGAEAVLPLPLEGKTVEQLLGPPGGAGSNGGQPGLEKK
jgi:hypothetical protein